MFGFGKSMKDPLSDVKAAERWLATLPGADTLAVHSNVIGELERAARHLAPVRQRAHHPYAHRIAERRHHRGQAHRLGFRLIGMHVR